MKKTKPKQLQLSRQTIAKLTRRDLEDVQGGHHENPPGPGSDRCYTAACVPTQACLN